MSYSNTPEGRAAHARADARYNSTSKGRARNVRAIRKYRATEEGRLKDRARQVIRNDIAAGRLVRPVVCDCGGLVEGCQVSPVQAHHEDHSKPRDVRWLSQFCHRLADAALLASQQEAELAVAA